MRTKCAVGTTLRCGRCRREGEQARGKFEISFDNQAYQQRHQRCAASKRYAAARILVYAGSSPTHLTAPWRSTRELARRVARRARFARRALNAFPHNGPVCRALLLGLALGLGVRVDAKTAPGSFSLAPRSNTSSVGGCGITVNWPGSRFANNRWEYAPYDCKDYWTYEYTVNVTAQPSGFGRYAVSSGFQQSFVTLMNEVQSHAGFDYKVTLECPLIGISALSCNGTLLPGAKFTCQLATVPNQWSACAYDYAAVIQIHNRNWVYSAESSIDVRQPCTNDAFTGADLCSNGAFYGFLDTVSPTPLLGYVTGGCVSDLAPGANCGGAAFCCPNGAQPTNVTSCGTGDGTYSSPCYDCTGGC